MRKLCLAVTLAVFFAGFAWSTIQKENHLANGKRIVLALAPADPRSLMQGDYMRLDFELAQTVRDNLPKENDETTRNRKRWNQSSRRDGKVVVAVKTDGTARFVRLDNGSPLKENEALLFYRLRDERVRLASGSFFFQEGQGDVYSKAKFAELRLNQDGHPLIADLLDENKVRIDGKRVP